MIESLYKLLSSFGYTDPIHAPITHMPVGLAIGAFIFFVVAIIFKRKQLVITARHVAILAFLFAFPTILFGVFDWIHFYHGILLPAIKIKMFLAGALLVVLGTGVVLGGEVKLHSLWMTIIYAICVGLVVALGWFGAGLIYGRGAPQVTAGPAPAPASQPAPAQTAPQAPAPKAAPAPAPAKPAVPVGNAKAGQALFADNCQACHGNGQNVIVASLPIVGSKRLASLPTFLAFIRAPAMPDGSEGQMPPFGSDVLSDAQAKDLYAYVTTAWK